MILQSSFVHLTFLSDHLNYGEHFGEITPSLGNLKIVKSTALHVS